ncbi:peptidase inhibitor family I36 protein [Kibdelosporangium lantanae]|uniref:Peptidase inhibitor family I36 protein n=1 Tax=Kibdelosporangium lantanae TaxID=1497396 RepID=A0ABW3M364_9PSEU
MIGKKTVLAAMTAIATLGLIAPAASAAPYGTITLTRADNSTVTLPWQAGPDGSFYAVDPLKKGRSSGIENAAVRLRPPSLSGQPCLTDSVCIYQDANWQGWVLEFDAGGGTGHLGYYGCDCHSTHHPDSDGTWSDQMSSWQNNTNLNYCWSFDSGAQGERHLMARGEAVNAVTAHENDEATSVFTC